MPPTDRQYIIWLLLLRLTLLVATIYRLYEVILVHGESLKSIIHEKVCLPSPITVMLELKCPL